MEGVLVTQSGADRGGWKGGCYLFGSALDAAKLQARQVDTLRPRQRGCSIVGINDKSYSTL